MLRFWPVLIPILLVVIYFVFFRKKEGDEVEGSTPSWESKLWVGAFIASALVFIVTIFILIFTNGPSNRNGEYTPAQLQNGQVTEPR